MSEPTLTKEEALAQFREKKADYDTLSQQIKDLREDVKIEERMGLLEKQVEALKALNDFKKRHGL